MAVAPPPAPVTPPVVPPVDPPTPDPGPGQLSVSRSTHDFSATDIGTSGQASVTVTNTGESVLPGIRVTLTGDTEFSITSDSCSDNQLVVGEACTLGVRFTPVTTGARGGILTFQAGGSTASVTLEGTGVVLSSLAISPSFALLSTRVYVLTTTPSSCRAPPAAPPRQSSWAAAPQRDV
ncbi:MAG: choice-of-anchor D domain-containing protein [Aeromicrobium sp.]